MKISKPEDSAAKSIQFGVEFETGIPARSGIVVGGYHRGSPVLNGTALDGRLIHAPSVGERYWRAERDSSIRCEPGFKPCEFVSPILSGDEGVAKLRQMIAFIREIGGVVNDSCGCHITIGIASVIGSTDTVAHADFCRRLAHIAQANAWAIYAQTGTGRHTNQYSGQLAESVERTMRQLVRARDRFRQEMLISQCERKVMVNFKKAFTHGVIEFRAFAGTLNEKKILHHLATVFGLVRRAATVQQFGKFNRKATKKHSKISNAVEAVRRMWRLLGWVDSVPGRDCALGLFGPLHSEFGQYRNTAIEMAEKFEQRYPAANL